jgi:hypothetical protein
MFKLTLESRSQTKGKSTLTGQGGEMTQTMYAHVNK